MKTKSARKTKLSREQLRLLSELERQEYYTGRLPDDFKFPLFSGRQAVLSQRQSGYRTTARAAREIVDNALEAGAKNVRVIFDQPNEMSRVKHERKNSVRAIAFIDDGPGMSAEMARYSLTWGGGTHFEDANYIGKFGFGLPNSSINQTTQVQVFTRTGAEDPWHEVELDINHVDEFGEVTIEEGENVDGLPEFVSEYLDRNSIELTCGTVVVWVRPDRLTYNQASSLKEHLLDDFGVTYRYMLPRYEADAETGRQKMMDAGKFRLFVEDKAVESIDPLFLTPGARYFQAPTGDTKGGAWEAFGNGTSDGRQIPVKYFIEEETGARRLAWLKTDDELEAAKDDPMVRAVGYIHIRIGRMPPGFVDGQIAAKKSGAITYKRFQIRQARRGVSFVRAGREIETLDAFPRSAHDVASGLGDWPHISTYAYHFGVEIKFAPDLDEAFGVGNDKQTIRPIDDFWRVMAAEGVELDKAVRAEEKYQQASRKREKEKKAEPGVTDPTKSEPAATAAEAAKSTMGGSRNVPDHRSGEAQTLTQKAIEERREITGESVEDARKAIEEEAKRKRYSVEFFSAPGGAFYVPTYGNGMQRVVKINKDHPFYSSFYAKIAALPMPIARQTVDLLLMALADAELQASEEMEMMYEGQRESVWSPFLKYGLKKLEELEPHDEEEDVNGQD
jgi:hypothetical protein